MSEVEKQESQKTVVAFITGLLIGGLLVWVFSSTPEDKKQPEEKTTDTEQVAGDEEKSEEVKTESKEEVVASDEVVGKGVLEVADQAAGKTVKLGKVEFPTKSGWIVVREFMDGTPGNVLGAARYSAAEGLVPASVELMRETVKASSYQVVFFTNKGDAGFSLAEDKAIAGGEVTFKAN